MLHEMDWISFVVGFWAGGTVVCLAIIAKIRQILKRRSTSNTRANTKSSH